MFISTRAGYASAAGATSHAIPLTDPTAIGVGNTLVVTLYNSADRTMTVADDAGNTWQVVAGAVNGSNDKAHVARCTVDNAYSAGDEITLTFSGSTHVAATVAEFGPTLPIDESASQGSAANPSTEAAFTSGLTATTTASRLLVIGVVTQNGNADTITVDGSFAEYATQNGSSLTRASHSYWWEDTGGPAQYEFSGDFPTARNWVAMVVAIEVVAGGIRNIYVGDQQVQAVYIGTTEVLRVYEGDELIHDATT